MNTLSTSQPPTVNHAKVRVLFISFAYIVSVYQSKLKALVDHGADVAWLAPKKWKMRTWNKTIPLEVRFENIKIFPLNIRFMNGVNGGYLYPTLPLLSAINRFKPDILHYEQEVFSLSAFQVAVWAKKLKIPFTVFCWENIEKKLPFYRWWTTKYVLNHASGIIAGSSEAAEIIKKWGFNRKIAIMPQIGVDTNLFFPQGGKEKKEIVTIAYLGRLVPEKGVDLLLEAGKVLIDKGINLQIVICGSGRNELELHTLSKKLYVADYVKWLRDVNHDAIPEILASVDVLVLPSRTVPNTWKEQFGHVLVEAMAMGIPVVGSNSGAIPEVIGRTDLIFSENNSKELVRILERLIIDREWALEVSDYLEKRAVENYSDLKIADQLISLWQEIISSAGEQFLL